jgi:cytochrome c oxidase assembly protein subunit 15
MSYRPILYKLALCTAIAIAPLILVGASVTSKEAGMAFPDWPTSDSHLLNPPGWIGDPLKLWEHGHRLIGWAVGMLAIALAAAAWRSGGWIRAGGTAVLLAIIVQGVLGGLRVTEISTELALVHGVWGQLCFCLACVMALITSRRWATSHEERIAGDRVVLFRRSCVAALISLESIVTLVRSGPWLAM